MINQVRFSKSVIFFEEGFLQRWGVLPYHDKDAPCLFAGVYNHEDVEIINKHKGFKIVWNTGRKRDLFESLDNNIVVMTGNGIEANIGNKYKSKNVNIEIKDFSIFKPVPLGDFVYAYLGKPEHKELYGYNIINEISRKIPFKILIGYLGHEMDFVKRNYYDKSFINIKINLIGGFTTTTELAHMGRKTISNTKSVLCTPYKDVDDIVNLIMAESLSIGSMPENRIPKGYFTGVEWLNESFWL